MLILVPTRELARQIHAHFMDIGSYTRLTAEVITGGENRGHQVSALRRNPDILVATPGRMLEHLETGEAELGDLEHLVLDEADRMLDMGFAEQVFAILGAADASVNRCCSPPRCNSEACPPWPNACCASRTIIVDVVREPHPDITHQILLSDDPEHKREQLLRLLRDEPAEAADDRAPAPSAAIHAGKTLVFVNTRERADQLGSWLVGQQQRCAVLHGDLDQRERKRVMGLFRDGSVDVLIATDVAARGLDVPGVQRVINFDVPRSGDDYLHRTGRTGRAGEQGLAITLVSSQEWNRMEGIQRYLHLDVKQRAIKGLEARFKGAPTRAKPGRRRLIQPPGPKPPKRRSKPRPATSPSPKTAPVIEEHRQATQTGIGKPRPPRAPRLASSRPSGAAPDRSPGHESKAHETR